MNSVIENQKRVIEKINDKWSDLVKDGYLCYSVKELAYKVAYDLLEQVGRENLDMYILYKFYNGKHKIVFEIEENMFFGFDIMWESSIFGGNDILKIGNAKVMDKVPNGYEEINAILQDEEE